jgi:tRNA dimethylallyltransferase
MHTKPKALSIVGPTAVGKTATALWLAERLLAEKKVAGVELISADSRQVYAELQVLTGADLPHEWIEKTTDLPYRFFVHPQLPISLHGVQIISCRDEWSAAHFLEFARAVLTRSWEEGRLPIVVGGTGMYLQQLTAPAASLGVAPNLELRKNLETLSVGELQSQLAILSPSKLEQLNNSDRNNPRRLIRAIEVLRALLASESAETTPVAATVQTQETSYLADPTLDSSQTVIGLRDELPVLAERIGTRVLERFHSGAQQEVARILADPTGVTKQALSTLGVQEVAAYLEGGVEEAEVIERWSRRELQYAKRQLTWLKKYGNATWFSVSDREYREAALANCLLTI